MKSNILYTDIPDYELLSSEKTWYDQKILNKLVPLDKIKFILDEIIRQWMQKGQGQYQRYFYGISKLRFTYLTWKKVERKRDEKLYRARLGGFYLMVLSDFLLVMGLILELTFRTGHLFEVILPFSFIISTVFIVIIIIKSLV